MEPVLESIKIEFALSLISKVVTDRLGRLSL